MESSIQTQIAISLLPKLNSGLFLPLIEKCGGIEGYFRENDKALNAIYQEFNIPLKLFDRTQALQEADKELTQMDKYGIQVCSMESGLYPFLLKQCEDFPLVFYYKGNIQTEVSHKLLAIVGTRRASSKYQAKVESTIEELSHLNTPLTIVSGLAYGIDASAHRACLKYGVKTFAVLGHGLHMIYPATHQKMAEHILKTGGALISEFPCTGKIHPHHFLRRNRIIAGLCHATLIAESARKGGAMATAHFALSYNREVMAFPGRFDDPYSSGCNQLIKENTAALVENCADIAHILGISVPKVSTTPTIPNLFDTNSNERTDVILQYLKKEEDVSMDELIQVTNIPQGELSALLLQLELEGKIFVLPGKRYNLKY